MKSIVSAMLLFVVLVGSEAQNCVKPIPFGDFENWTVRHIKESGLLGGKKKQLYVIGPTDTIVGNKAYTYYGTKTLWCASNAYVNVIGIVKGSNSTFPEKRGNGYCARMDGILETVIVAGLVDIKVIISGSMFLGKTIEPVRNANEPYRKIDMGIPFTNKPKALMFDYKVKISQKNEITKSNGFRLNTFPGKDAAMVFVYLQKRWEDEKGNIYAKRIGTAHMHFDKTVSEWQNAYQMPIYYGDITSTPYYQSYMGLFPEHGIGYCAENRFGKMEPINEVGWGDANDTPTHLIIMFSSSIQPAWCGVAGNAFWVDNVKLLY